jgi:Stress responsive A/B Barrel Domain
MPIQHVVLVYFTPDISKADQAEFRQRVESSSNDIGRMLDLRFARLVEAESAKGYQYIMSMVFENNEDLDNYMDHPVHGQLYEWVVARGCELLVFDYDLDEARALRQPD